MGRFSSVIAAALCVLALVSQVRFLSSFPYESHSEPEAKGIASLGKEVGKVPPMFCSMSKGNCFIKKKKLRHPRNDEQESISNNAMECLVVFSELHSEGGPDEKETAEVRRESRLSS